MAHRFTLLLLATVLVVSATVDLEQHENVHVAEEEETSTDDTIMMQTVAQFDGAKQAPAAIWSMLLRAVFGILLLLPAIAAYVGVPEFSPIAFAWSSNLFSGVGHEASKHAEDSQHPHVTSGRFLATMTNSTSSPRKGLVEHQLNEQMLDQILQADLCCDVATPNLQTSVKLFRGRASGVKQNGDNADTTIPEEAIDAILADEPDEPALPTLQTGFKLSRGRASKVNQRGANADAAVSDEVIDAMLADASEEAALPSLQTNLELFHGRASKGNQLGGNAGTTVQDKVIDAMLADASDEAPLPTLQTGVEIFRGHASRGKKATDNSEMALPDDVIDTMLADATDEAALPALQTGVELFKKSGSLVKTTPSNPLREAKPGDGNAAVSDSVIEAMLADSSEEALMRTSLPRGFSIVKKAKRVAKQEPKNEEALVSNDALDAMLSEPSIEEAMQTTFVGRKVRNAGGPSAFVDKDGLVSDEVLDAILSDPTHDDTTPALQMGISLFKDAAV